MGYKTGELERLHGELYDILGHVIELCDTLQIEYFVIGGSAIGAHFDGAILPWDDDIDIGMERAQYDRFLREATAVMPCGYTLQSPIDEANTPYYFAKVRKDGTLFEASDELGLEMHHGIYIDIFPFDRVPDSVVAERAQRNIVRVLSNMFVAAAGKLTGARWLVVLYEFAAKLFGKAAIYKMLCWAQSLFNRRDTKYVSIIKMDRDHIERSTLHPPQRVPFGPLMVNMPQRALEYLQHHYVGLNRDLPESERINHAPLRLKFSDDKGHK